MLNNVNNFHFKNIGILYVLNQVIYLKYADHLFAAAAVIEVALLLGHISLLHLSKEI